MRVFLKGTGDALRVVTERGRVLFRGDYSTCLSWLIDEGCTFADHDGPVEGVLPYYQHPPMRTGKHGVLTY